MRQTLQYHVIALRLIVLNQVVVLRAGLHHQGVRRLANLALEGLPEIRGEVGLQLGLLLGLEPARQAAVVDLAHGAGAAAGTKEWVLLGRIRRPAEAALVLGVLVRHITERTWHRDEFFELLILAVREDRIGAVSFLLLVIQVIVHGVVRVADLLDGKFHATDLQNVMLLNFIILPKE